MSEDKSTVPSMLKMAKLPNNGWTPEQEELLAEWSDKGLCYRWLHDKTEKKYTRLNAMFTIPIIVLSTLTGTASVGLDSFVPVDFQKNAQGIVGGVSILTGIIGTVANFLRYAQGMEAHRSAGVSWGKLQRRIAVELALAPPQRTECSDFLKLCRAEMDRLIEQSPTIPDDIVAQFEAQFRGVRDVKRPEVCNTLEHTRVFRDVRTPHEKLLDVTSKATSILKTREGEDIKRTLGLDQLEVQKEVVQRKASVVAGGLQQSIDDDLARLRASKAVSKWRPLARRDSQIQVTVPTNDNSTS
jgi:hypothetical protein